MKKPAREVIRGIRSRKRLFPKISHAIAVYEERKTRPSTDLNGKSIPFKIKEMEIIIPMRRMGVEDGKQFLIKEKGETETEGRRGEVESDILGRLKIKA